MFRTEPSVKVRRTRPPCSVRITSSHWTAAPFLASMGALRPRWMKSLGMRAVMLPAACGAFCAARELARATAARAKQRTPASAVRRCRWVRRPRFVVGLFICLARIRAVCPEPRLMGPFRHHLGPFTRSQEAVTVDPRGHAYVARVVRGRLHTDDAAHAVEQHASRPSAFDLQADVELHLAIHGQVALEEEIESRGADVADGGGLLDLSAVLLPLHFQRERQGEALCPPAFVSREHVGSTSFQWFPLTGKVPPTALASTPGTRPSSGMTLEESMRGETHSHWEVIHLLGPCS